MDTHGIIPPQKREAWPIKPPVDRPEKIIPPPCPPQMNTVKVDPTLTKSGWAADAKVTGDVVDVAKQYSEEAKEAAERSDRASAHPPIISDNLTWLIWDKDIDDYVDTGVQAQGIGKIYWKEIDD